jgi:uncharacterized protein DUF6411
MTILAVIAFCVVLLVLAFLVPRLSRRVERGGSGALGVGQRAGAKAPGPLGRLFQKPFRFSRKAVHKSGSAGRRGRAKAPF